MNGACVPVWCVRVEGVGVDVCECGCACAPLCVFVCGVGGLSGGCLCAYGCVGVRLCVCACVCVGRGNLQDCFVSGTYNALSRLL